MYKAGVDGASLMVLLGAITGWLPAIATALTVLWTVLRIVETKPVQNWMSRRKVKGAKAAHNSRLFGE